MYRILKQKILKPGNLEKNFDFFKKTLSQQNLEKNFEKKDLKTLR